MILGKRKLEQIDPESTVDHVKRLMASLDSILYFTKQVASFDRIRERLEMMCRVNIDRDQIYSIIKLINEHGEFYELTDKLVFHLPTDQKKVSDILGRKSKIATVLKNKDLVQSLGAVLSGNFGVLIKENPLKKIRLQSKIIPRVHSPLDVLMRKRSAGTQGASPVTSDCTESPVKLTAKERIAALKSRVLQRKKERDTALKHCDVSHLQQAESPTEIYLDPFLSLLMDIITTKFISDRRVQANCDLLCESIEKAHKFPFKDISEGVGKLARHFMNIGKSEYFKCYTWKDHKRYIRCIPETASKIFHKQILSDKELKTTNLNAPQLQKIECVEDSKHVLNHSTE
eukprot:NODE_321_length_11054_cov_0.461524.p3 type:complete len:344 gc:universal NODE_321_length_11054_cov_0.461524:9491-8460(-)